MTQSLSFSSWGKGELSPINRGHIDLEQYYASAESLDNMIVRPYAVPVRRAGTKYAGLVKDSDKDTRLIEFVFSVNESYIIEMGDLYFRFWDSDGVPITFDLSTVAAWQDTYEYAAGDVVSSTSTPWINAVYAIGNYRTNIGNLYICIKVTASLPLVEEPGVGSDWETYWTLIGDEDRFFLCTQDHTSVTVENKPRFDTDWADVWYDMSAAAGLTDSDWIVEVDTPYTEAEIWDVDYAQKDDTLKLTHLSHDIAELRRYADNKWAFLQGVIEGPPWEDLNDDVGNGMKPGADLVGGTSNLVADKATFTADDVGRYMRLNTLNSDLVQGYIKITAYSSPTVVSMLVIVALIGTGKTTKWAFNSFYTEAVSGDVNYPAHVTYYEDRLVLANSTAEPQKIWLSKSNIYNDFNVTDADDGGFDMVLNTEQANDIKWISSGESLASGTFGAEFTSRSPSDGSLNNTNKNARRQSGWGSDFIRPKKIGNRVYFVQRTGRKLREYLYIDAYDNYAAEDMTKYSDHITLSGIVDMDYQRNQDSLLWCVLGNGKMAILSRHPDEEVQAWTPFETDGEVKSIRFIPNPDGESDRGFIICERVIDGSTVKYIEYFDNHVIEDDTLQADLYYVDSGVAYSQVAADVPFTGLDHLEGETVAIFIDGVCQDSGTVVSGSVANPTSPTTWSKAAVGLPFTSTIKTNPLNAQTPTGMAKGHIRGINGLSVELYRSKGVEYSSDGVNWFDIGVPEGVDSSVLYTGTVANLTFDGGKNYEGYIYLRQRRPSSMNLLGIYPELKFSY